jgi:hypothetical protein
MNDRLVWMTLKIGHSITTASYSMNRQDLLLLKVSIQSKKSLNDLP